MGVQQQNKIQKILYHNTAPMAVTGPILQPCPLPVTAVPKGVIRLLTQIHLQICHLLGSRS